MIPADLLNDYFEYLLDPNLVWDKTVSPPTEIHEVYQNVTSIINSFRNMSTEKIMEILPGLILLNEKKISQSKISKILDEFRKIHGSTRSFGKISNWKIKPGGYMGEHADFWPYHKMVDRYILNINMDTNVSAFKVDGKNLSANQGEIFRIDHDLIHSVTNSQNTDMYFVQIDLFKYI